MTKEELIEKYPNVLAEIVKDLIKKGSNKPKLLNELWNEYLEENKPKSDFKVLCINLSRQNQLWLSDKTNHFCGTDGKNVIEYEKGLLLGTITSIKYKDIQFSIDDVVQYLDKTYTIHRFEREQVNLKGRNSAYYYETHISNIIKLKPIGVSYDGFDIIEEDIVSVVYFNGKVWSFLFENLKISLKTSLKPVYWNNSDFKIFHNKDNALKFIEENNKKVLFTTEDNVEIEEGDYFYVLYKNGEIGKWKAHFRESWIYKQKDGRLCFSTEESIEEYKSKHVKVLSYDDVMIYLSTSDNLDNDILNLVKERLNQK